MNNPFVSLAPETMLQSILRGWIFAQTVYVNDNNSSMPEAEKAIVSQDSYGRQLGKVMDALALLVLHKKKEQATGDAISEIDARIQAFELGAFDDLLNLHAKIEKTKQEHASQRCTRIRGDLAYLKIAEPDHYKALVEEIARSHAAGANSRRDATQ
jgi:hypothetical protein